MFYSLQLQLDTLCNSTRSRLYFINTCKLATYTVFDTQNIMASIDLAMGIGRLFELQRISYLRDTHTHKKNMWFTYPDPSLKKKRMFLTFQSLLFSKSLVRLILWFEANVPIIGVANYLFLKIFYNIQLGYRQLFKWCVIMSDRMLITFVSNELFSKL